MKNDVDVIVVGGGNAGFSAAHAAAARGRTVLVLEKADERDGGGNSYYTAGATRIGHDGLDDLRELIDPDERVSNTVVPAYPASQYADDIARVNDGRNDPELTEVLVTESLPALSWLHSLGMHYRLMYERQAYPRADGSYLFWGGLHIGNTGGGEGLIADHRAIAARLGETVLYECEVTELLVESGRVVGVVAQQHGQRREYRAESVILAAGGFEANPELRRRYLGEEWVHAKLRGTPCNTGTLIEAGLRAGADRAGDWGGAHSVQWDAWAPDNESNRTVTNRLTRQGYPYGILVNRLGERFVDEGEDFRNYTYAKFGREVLKQPDHIGFQVFDATTRPLLRAEEYEMPNVSEIVADTLEEAARTAGIDVEAFLRTVAEFNDAVDDSHEFDPTVKDGRSSAVTPRKSNWASRIETAPFYIYPVSCGITFTFGGLRGDSEGRVLDTEGRPIPGLFVCGEMLGGLFSTNYPGGSGLAAGMVFGRRAGRQA